MRKRGSSHRLLVILLDLAMLLLINIALLVLYRTNFRYLGLEGVLAQMLLSVVTVFLFRTLLGVYRQVWHYADAPAFMKLMIADILAMAVHYTVQHFLPFNRMSLMRTMALFAGNLLLAMSARMGWQYLYKIKSRDSRLSEMFRNIIENLTGIRIRPGEADEGAVGQKTNIAIVGAGRIGTALADELLANPRSTYLPVFFIDNDKEKIGRWISGLKVFDEEKDELHSTQLVIGTMIEITYLPDRRLIIKYLGGNSYLIVESQNSKLLSGDLLHIEHIVRGYPLLVSEVVRDGASLGSFTAGKAQGINYRINE